MVQHVANKTRWGVAHHLDHDGTFLSRRWFSWTGRGHEQLHQGPDRLTDGLSLVLLDEGEKEFMGQTARIFGRQQRGGSSRCG